MKLIQVSDLHLVPPGLRLLTGDPADRIAPGRERYTKAG